jgi:acetyltransferase-like isoleucine patch superfamily enzyme
MSAGIRVAGRARAIMGGMSDPIDPTALVESSTLGAGSRILPFARISHDVEIHSNCTVDEHAVLVGPILLEDDVHVRSGARLIGHIHLERGVKVGAGAVLASDPPGDTATGDGACSIVVRRFASIGANATILPGVTVGRQAVVEPGSVVTHSVPANAIVRGNPATIVAYVDSVEDAPAPEVSDPLRATSLASRVRGVTLHRLTHVRDLRGALTALEFGDLPFTPRRMFAVYDVPNESVRGAHAHRQCSQLLLCLTGGLSCLIDDGTTREEIRLGRRDLGLHIPPMVWGTQWRYTRDASLLVLASHPYDPDDYIRDYEEFLDLVEARAPAPSTTSDRVV